MLGSVSALLAGDAEALGMRIISKSSSLMSGIEMIEPELGLGKDGRSESEEVRIARREWGWRAL